METITKLTAKVALEYGQKKAESKALEAELKAAADQIKDLMEPKTDGEGKYEYSPPASPFKLCYSEYDKTQWSWKDECENMYREHFGKKWKLELARRQNAAGNTTVRELESKPNERYKPEED